MIIITPIDGLIAQTSYEISLQIGVILNIFLFLMYAFGNFLNHFAVKGIQIGRAAAGY